MLYLPALFNGFVQSTPQPLLFGPPAGGHGSSYLPCAPNSKPPAMWTCEQACSLLCPHWLTGCD